MGSSQTKSKLIVLCGIPASGKSSFAEQHPTYHVLSRDTLRENMGGKDYKHTRNNENKITDTFNFWFNNYTKNGYNVILDNCHTKEAYLDEWIKRCPKDYTVQIIFFDIPLWKAMIRNVGRYVKTGKWIPIKIMKSMKKNYNKINRKKYEHLVLK